MGGAEVGYNRKTPGRGTGRISSYAVPQAEVKAIHHLCPTNIVYFRHKHSDIHTELLDVFRQQDYLMQFKI
jgi:hypothetical protein